MKLTIRAIISALIVVLGSLLFAQMQSRPNAGLHSVQDSNFTLEGKVTQKSDGKLTVSTEENIVFHVRYDEKTAIRLKDGTQGSNKDLKTGLTVAVQGDFKSGEILAHTIQVL